MKKILLSIVASLAFLWSTAQDQSCLERLEKAFSERGSYTVSDDIHRNVIISFFENGDVYCVKGKARVENGTVSSIFIYFEDNTSELYDKKFYNQNKQPPIITNGISEMATAADGSKFRVVFLDKLRPEPKRMIQAELPARQDEIVIKMKKMNSGTYEIPCKVNGLSLNFIFDTGASDVSISLSEAQFMFKNGYLHETDVMGSQFYSLADGSIAEGTIINLRKLSFGGMVMNNVKASIIHEMEAPLLLGQSAISRLGVISIDPVKSELIVKRK